MYCAWRSLGKRRRHSQCLALLHVFVEFGEGCYILEDSTGRSKQGTSDFYEYAMRHRWISLTVWLTQQQKGDLDLLALHDFVVKVSVFLKAVGPLATLEPEDAEIFSKYATKLSEQGLFVTAAKYSR
jgi:hypothetical protein